MKIGIIWIQDREWLTHDIENRIRSCEHITFILHAREWDEFFQVHLVFTQDLFEDAHLCSNRLIDLPHSQINITADFHILSFQADA